MDALSAFKEAESRVETGREYRHFKGGAYLVITVALEEMNLSPVVIYKQVETGIVFTRPLDSFLEEVDLDGVKTPRFKPM